MEENVFNEIYTLKKMVANWKRSFMTWATPDGDNDYIIIEFNDEIQQHLYPYVTRLLETEHLTEPEARELMNHCYAEVEDLRIILDRIGNKDEQIP